MSIVDSAKTAMFHKLGPFPTVAWVGIAGASYAMYRTIKKSGGAASSAGAGSGASPGTGTSGGGGSQFPPTTLNPGQSVYDPSNGGSLSTAPAISPKDLLGGSVTDFAKALGPNYNSFSFTTDGTSVGVNNSAQNVIDAANYQAQLQAATQQALNQEQYTLGLYQSVPAILQQLSAGGFNLANYNNVGQQSINPFAPTAPIAPAIPAQSSRGTYVPPQHLPTNPYGR